MGPPRRARSLLVAAALSVLATLPVLAEDAAPAETAAEPVIANTGSARVEFAAREWLDVGLDVNGVRVDRLQLREANKFQRFFTKNDEANRGRLWITNRTKYAVSPALAVAVLDKEGRLLAAANTGARTRHVEPGASIEMELKFGGVFRHIELGDYILVSIEY